jgi:hypothetical protein
MLNLGDFNLLILLAFHLKNEKPKIMITKLFAYLWQMTKESGQKASDGVKFFTFDIDAHKFINLIYAG